MLIERRVGSASHGRYEPCLWRLFGMSYEARLILIAMFSLTIPRGTDR
jgi:hypothetical protein